MSLSKPTRSIVLDRPVARFTMSSARQPPVPPVAVTPIPSAPPAPPAPDLEAIRRKAFAEGEAQGRRAVADLQRMAAEKFACLERELEQYFDNLERAIFEQVIDLSVKVAEKILRHAMPDAEMLRSVLREILQRITDLERVQVRLHPDDVRLLQPQLESGAIAAAGRLEIVADATLQPGDMLVENGFGCFDARLEERLQGLRDELLKRWRRDDAHTTAN